MAGEHAGRRVGPKIAALLGRPAARDALTELDLCVELGVPPSRLRGRPTVTSYEYDQYGRVARTITGSPWTVEDRALMLARQLYRQSLCRGCGHPKATAWHPDNEGWFESVASHVCHGCTAQKRAGKDRGPEDPVTYHSVADTRDYETDPLPVLNPEGVAG